MKTPEEIKKGLCRYLSYEELDCGATCRKSDCPYRNDSRLGEATCGDLILEDTLAYIQKLEANYQQVSKALCGKENATVEEILQAVDQMKGETDE